MKKRVLTALILLNLAFIWGNSALPAGASNAVSQGMMGSLSRLFPFLAQEWFHVLLRKGAHFSEFALLGFLSGLRRPQTTWPEHLGFGMAVAAVDETIQLYVPGRSSSLLDVWLDTAGFLTGAAVARLVIKLQIRHHKT